MTRKRHASLLATALVFGAGAAASEAKLAPVLDELRAQGLGTIELDRDGDHIRIEAGQGEGAREVIFDVALGRVISDRING